ncbi:hypothetical protein BSG1_09893 [Bacillus sp. SG-1]|nr:hypothetical protein BSG1_09893 [Bacillus sp. SG-1]
MTDHTSLCHKSEIFRTDCWLMSPSVNNKRKRLEYKKETAENSAEQTQGGNKDDSTLPISKHV